MPDFKQSTGYKMKGMDFGEGTGMSLKHNSDIENENIKKDIGTKPVDHLQNATPEEQAHNDAADKSEGTIKQQARRARRNQRRKNY